VGKLLASCGLADFRDGRGLRVDPGSTPTCADHDDRPARRQPEALSTGSEEAVIRAWLTAIGETDQAIVAEVLTACRSE